MADSDKNATNYWCKYCKTFVRNSPLERRNHESSPRHQGSLQRFLKELHKTNEREEREKQRAKAEVARLNGVKPGSESSAVSRSKAQRETGSGSQNGSRPSARQATREDRKQQMAQLAAMGVVVPEEYRKENAMAGEWETVTVQPTQQSSLLKPRGLKREGEETKPVATDLANPERKRKVQDDDQDAGYTRKGVPQPNWGSDVRTYRDIEADDDLDALLAGSASAITRKVKPELGGSTPLAGEDIKPKGEQDAASGSPKVKERTSDPDLQTTLSNIPGDAAPSAAVEPEDEAQPDIGSMFKKRKKKASRQD